MRSGLPFFVWFLMKNIFLRILKKSPFFEKDNLTEEVEKMRWWEMDAVWEAWFLKVLYCAAGVGAILLLSWELYIAEPSVPRLPKCFRELVLGK